MKGSDVPIPQLGGRTWMELELIEDESDRILFKDQIRQRQKAGWRAIDVRVRVPRPLDLLRARKEAREAFLRMGLDESKDKDLFGDIEQLAILALCIRTAAPPHGQFADADELGQHYDEASLRDVQARIAHYRELVDPREVALTEEQVFEALLAIRRVGHLGPLVDIGGDAQRSFVLRTVELACLSPTVQSYALSRVTSTPVGSPRQSSEGS